MVVQACDLHVLGMQVAGRWLVWTRMFIRMGMGVQRRRKAAYDSALRAEFCMSGRVDLLP